MGRKIFVSYKYADSNVKNLTWNQNSTVRDYVTKFQDQILNDDEINKGEEDGEDLSQLSDDTIWEKLKDRIYDSSVTVIFISPNMKDSGKAEREQWIPWEISYSLKEISRKNKSGKSITSTSNAMLAVVLPDSNGSYSYYLESHNCCSSSCQTHHTENLFYALRKNKFNLIEHTTRDCDSVEGKIWTSSNPSYIESVKWDAFIKNYEKYIDAAVERKNNIEDYDICKDAYLK